MLNLRFILFLTIVLPAATYSLGQSTSPGQSVAPEQSGSLGQSVGNASHVPATARDAILYCQTHLSDAACQPLLRPEELANSVSSPDEGEIPAAPPAAVIRTNKKFQEKTEFQLFVADALGKQLCIFGADLFDDVPSTFAPIDHAPVPANYVVGPGDQLNIRVWGMISLNERVTIDRNGQIYLPKVGEISVAGVSYSDLEAHLHSQLQQVFREFRIAVTLGKLRTIDIFVVGQARQPGKYTISSLSTLVNALFATGGPAPQGSLRHIRLMREGKEISDFDLYELLLRGDKSKDVPLLPGDVIYIPPVGPEIAVAGSVNLPAIFELAFPETALQDVLQLAGGLDEIADGSRVTLERIDDRRVRSVTEFTLDAVGLAQPVKGGDLIRVLSIVPRFSNAVTLRGNVANPGRYPWRAGMRIRDLIPDPNILLTRKYWQTSNAIVRDSTDYLRSTKDATNVDVGAIRSAKDATNVDVGAIRLAKDAANVDAGAIRSTKDATNVDVGAIRNEVKISAPAINWEYAVVQRLDPVDLSSRLIAFSLRGAIIEKRESDNVELQPGDIVTIFSQRDIAVAQSQQTKLVRVEGEVRAPGIYRAEENETLAALIQRAGGLTKNAYLYGTQFTRESARIEQQDSLDQLTKLLESQIQQKAVNDSNANPSDSQAITARVAEQKMLVAQLKATEATGRVVLPIHPRDSSLASLPPVILEDKDAIIIPPRNATVSVIGAVYTQSSFLYRPGSKVSDYVRAAGNGTQSADMHHVMLIRANGSIIGKKQGFSVFDSDFQSLAVLPGDMIIIPTKLQSGAFGKALRDWTAITAQLAISAASLAVISR